VWNEPNEGRFWSGSFDQYLDLYRATSEVVSELGIDLRLGGPAMAYKPESEAEDGPETMSRFLHFLSNESNVLCNFISYHRKGTVDTNPPDPRRLRAAALEISDLIESIVPERAATLALINNEADERIGFETPYLPRMGKFAASWLTTLSTAHASLAMEQGRRFSAVQDNANLQLMQTSFDGRRSIYSFLDPDNRTDLVKTSGVAFYDVLPLLEGAIVQPTSLDDVFPNSDLHAICTVSDQAASLLLTWHPVGESRESQRAVSVSFTGFRWPIVTLTRWRIDDSLSNAYAIAEKLGTPEFTAADAVIIRAGQELSLEGPTQHYIETDVVPLNFQLLLAPYDTVMVWMTPRTNDPIDAPAKVLSRTLNGGTEIVWDSVEDPQLLGYEVARNGEVVAGPIRPCSWIDSIAIEDAGYAVRAVSASGV
ncbi:MAG: GH39 family glycosyl hydrolase, partial [Thermomicrobiales bacterium]